MSDAAEQVVAVAANALHEHVCGPAGGPRPPIDGCFWDEDAESCAEVNLTGIAAACVAPVLKAIADRIDLGPGVPLPPSVYSSLFREWALDASEATDQGDYPPSRSDDTTTA